MGGHGCSRDCVILPVFLLLGIMATVSTLYPHLSMNLNFRDLYVRLKYRLKHGQEQTYLGEL